MEKIKIKRATVDGLVDAEGYFFESNRMQFCLVEDVGFYFCIELHSGCSVKIFDTEDYSEYDSLVLSKEEINKRTKKEWETALKKVSEDCCPSYGFTLPVNEPIKK